MKQILNTVVTKSPRQGSPNVIDYLFPAAHIVVYVDKGLQEINPIARYLPATREVFEDIPPADRLGASNIEEYADALANGGYYFKTGNGGGGVPQTLSYTAPSLSISDGNSVNIQTLWGQIGGDITNQTDLITLLSGFATLSTAPAIASAGFDSSGNITLIPIFSNEASRDAAIPTPVDGQLCYLLNNAIQERYYAEFGLWKDSQMEVCIIDTAIPIKRVVEVETAFPVNGVEYPLLRFPTNATQQDRTLGVTMQIGNPIDVARSFVSVRTHGQCLCGYGEAIAAGETVEAKISGANSDIGLLQGSPTGSTGSFALSIQNSGSDPANPLDVLIDLPLKAEAF